MVLLIKVTALAAVICILGCAVSLSPDETPSDIVTNIIAEKSLRSGSAGLLQVAVTPLASHSLQIAAFNVQIFGTKKASDVLVMNTLSKIVLRYDIILIQEIRDASATVIQTLLNLVNSASHPYNMVASTRLGRTTSKEQYAFYYRSDKVNVTSTYQYPDILDWFQREPFTVRFSVPSAAISDFAIMAIHTEPGEAVREISHLVDVYEEVLNTWNIDDVLIAGDFNAACTYVRGSDWKDIALWTDDRFQWLIDSCADTTASDTDCAYDRFVAAGSLLQKAVVPGSAGPYVYGTELSSVPAINVSDHYPIAVAITGLPNLALQGQFAASVSLKVDSLLPSATAITDLQVAIATGETAGFEIKEFGCSGNMAVQVRSLKNVNVQHQLLLFSSKFPGILNDGMISMVLGYFESNDLIKNTYVYGLTTIPDSPLYDILIDCAINEKLCTLNVDCKIH